MMLMNEKHRKCSYCDRNLIGGYTYPSLKLCNGVLQIFCSNECRENFIYNCYKEIYVDTEGNLYKS